MNLLRALIIAVVLTVSAVGWAQDRTAPVTFTAGTTTFVADSAPGMANFVTAVREVIEREWPRQEAFLGIEQSEAITLSIEEEFEDWFVRNNVPAQPPEWAAGLALPSRRVILLRPGNPTWSATLAHELSHVGVAIASGDGDVPRWFDEGFAQRAAGQWDVERATTLVRAAVADGVLAWSAIEARFPSDAATAQVAYAQSHHFVRWSERRWGAETFSGVLARMRQGETFSSAFASQTGTLLSVAQAQWAEAVEVRYRWMPMAGGGGAVWAIASLGLAWGWRRRRRTRRLALERMARREEGVFSPDPDDERFG